MIKAPSARMNGSSANFSASALSFYWSECNTYDDAGKITGISEGTIVLFFTTCFEFFTGAPSNIWLICHILRKRSKVTGVLPADFFPLHLSLIQLSFYLVMPLVFANYFLWQSIPVLGVSTFLKSLVLVVKPLLLCLVCVERYMAVVRPTLYLRFKAPRYRWACLGFSWCILVLMASCSLIERSPDLLCALFPPVLLVDTFCSLSILRTLQKPPPGDKKTVTHEARVRGEMNAMKRKAFTTVVIIQAVLTFNYLPTIIFMFMKGDVPDTDMKCQYMTVANAAASSCSFLQPLLYLHRLGRLTCTKTKNT